MTDRIERPGVRRGYDLWATSYDATQNPLVALDRRHTLRALGPRPGEWILDAGCGTGANLGAIEAAFERMPGVQHRFMVGGTVPGFESYEDAVAAQPATPIADELEGQDMLYSSGTTGRPKCIKYAFQLRKIGTASPGMFFIR